MKPMIIAIDGYSSCGKSTLAKALAKRLGYAYLDTGAMYRAVSLYGIQNHISYHNLTEAEINRIIDKIHITFQLNEQSGENQTFLNGQNVESLIRGKAVSENVSHIAQIKAIRKRMVELQQKAGQEKKIVVDGRDIGSKVFPKADIKLFMTAKPAIRAKRRYDELVAKGLEVSLEEIEQNLSKRDYEDTHREENPLVQAVDAIVLDNSYLDKEEQLNFVLKLVEEELARS